MSIPGKLVEGVFKRVLAADLTPELITKLASVGVDVSGPMEPTYPRTTWYLAVELTAKTLFPEDGLPVQLRRLGGHIISCLQSRGIIKGAWLSMARLMGPRRALKQAMDFTDRSPVKVAITERAKNEFSISVDDTEQPDFLAGLLESAIAMLGGKAPEVSLEATRDGSCHFRATWR
ncbi:MAG: DUF2378 family protein [Archangium sp.]|nr:DUF2378 family protein [Archangium sp.]